MPTDYNDILSKSEIVVEPFRIKKDVPPKFPTISATEYRSLTEQLQNEPITTIEIIFWLLRQSPKIIQIIYYLIKLNGLIMEKAKSKDLITTIIGAVLAVLIAINPILQTGTVDYWELTKAGFIALLGYFTNKV